MEVSTNVAKASSRSTIIGATYLLLYLGNHKSLLLGVLQHGVCYGTFYKLQRFYKSLIQKEVVFLIEITPCRVEQPLQGMELQEKEGQTD